MPLPEAAGTPQSAATSGAILGLLHVGSARLERAGVPGGGRDAEWLLAAALGTSPAQLHLDAAAPVPVGAAERFERWCARRCAREPLQYILGSQPFRSIDVRVDRRVLIPRPETERVVDLCLEVYGGGPIADLGTGSGAIAIALATERPHEVVMATDVSAPALALAAENARRAGAGNVSFVAGDLFDPLMAMVGKLRLVVCNPPYVRTADLDMLEPEVRDWEPRIALDGGPDGLAFYRRLAPAAARALVPGAWVVVEIGAGQREDVEASFAATRAFDPARRLTDYRDIERGLAFRRTMARN
jgi:release factor glutamine methyltransferase